MQSQTRQRARRTLLTTFGSLAGVRRATREELAAAVGRKSPMLFLRFSPVGRNLLANAEPAERAETSRLLRAEPSLRFM